MQENTGRSTGQSTGRSTGQSTGTEALRIGMIGTRGVPAAYGGFETAIEEIGRRLAERGHEVVVHCRQCGARPWRPSATRPCPVCATWCDGTPM